MNRLAGLYVILDENAYGASLLTAADMFFQAGVRLVQYRAKNGINTTVLHNLIALSGRYDALLIVNDDLEAARLAGGLHVGQDDLAGRGIADLRLALPGKCIGVSCHTVEQAQQARAADYLGVGPLRETASKKVGRPPLGLAGIHEITQSVTIPVCAIGGCTLNDINDLHSAGVTMMAAIGALAKAVDPAQAAQQLMAAFSVLQ